MRFDNWWSLKAVWLYVHGWLNFWTTSMGCEQIQVALKCMANLKLVKRYPDLTSVCAWDPDKSSSIRIITRRQ